MFGLLHALASVATLLLMCDRRDLGTAIGEKPPKPDHGNAETESVQHAIRAKDAVGIFMASY